jgi:hypothetical protein
LSALSKHNIGELDLAFDYRAIAVTQRADRDNPGPIFIPQRQKKQQILHGDYAKPLQLGRQCFADSA